MITFYRRHTLLPLLILWLAFGLRLYRLDFQSIWWDEGHSIFVAFHSIPEIPTLPAMDVHPPAYFALLHLWLAVAGRSEFGLRYLSVLFSLLTIALLWRFAGLISDPQRIRLKPLSSPTPNHAPAYAHNGAPLLASLLAALSPFYVAYAQEVRSYAMITFLALASTFVLRRLLFPGRKPDMAKRRGRLLLYVFLTAACLYTHYFTVFLLLFQNLVWLAWVLFPSSAYSQSSRLSRFSLWAATQLGILLLFAPQFLLALRQVTSYTNPNLVPPTLTDFITRSWQAYTVGLTIDPGPARWGMGAIAGVLLIGWLIQVGAGQVKLVGRFVFLVFWLLASLVAYFAVLQRQPSFEPRYMMLVTPALFLLLALGLNAPTFYGARASRPRFYLLRHLPYGFRSYVPSFVIIIPIIAFVIALHSYYTNETYLKDDSAGVADWLAAETTANDIVYIDVPHPFHYYVEQQGIPAPTRYLFVDIHTAAETLTRQAGGRDRLFWVTWSGSDTDPRGVIPFLAEKAGQRIGQRDFRGYRVEWFDLPKQTTFSLPTTLVPTNATFGDVLRLDGVAFGGRQDTTTISVDELAWATLHYTLLRETEVDYRASLRLRDEDGRIVSQVDKDLLNDRHFHTSAWPLADPALNQALNVYTLPLAPDTPPGLYRLELVVYNAQPPYPGEGVTGHESDDGLAARLGRITVIP